MLKKEGKFGVQLLELLSGGGKFGRPWLGSPAPAVMFLVDDLVVFDDINLVERGFSQTQLAVACMQDEETPQHNITIVRIEALT